VTWEELFAAAAEHDVDAEAIGTALQRRRRHDG